MTTPMSEDGGPLREWAPLATLLQRIPAKIQNGIFTQDVNFTCIDALPEFIAVGTNRGIVYWYDRKTGELERLRCEKPNTTITCLKVVSTVDYMVAAGNDQGIVTVFQIPKQAPDSLPESLKPKTKKQVERYNIFGLHKQKVTAVEWSKNGEKLFSGDEGGLVVQTGIDFADHVSRSYELLNEKYSIIQLSIRQRLLLVSSLFRTIIVDQDDENKVSQIGQKERKSLGKLGAVFGSQLNQNQEPVIYASRPGLRLWQANKDGTVTKTLVFKDAVKTHQEEVELLNPAPENPKKVRGEPSFGVILSFFEDLLITYSEDIIYVVNPTTIAITSLVTDLRQVSCVACTKDEIFVLEGERNIIRIAYHPDSSTFASVPDLEPVLEYPLASIAQLSKPVTTSIMELTSKLKESAIIPAIPFSKIKPTDIAQTISILPAVTIGMDTTSIVKAEEALESSSAISPIKVIQAPNQNSTNKSPQEEQDRLKVFQKIGEQDFEDVVFSPTQVSKKPKPFEPNVENAKTTHSALLTLSMENSFTMNPDRNLETMQKEVESKEKLLALSFDLSEYMTSSKICIEEPLQENENEGDFEGVIEEANEVSECTETESLEDEDASYKTEVYKMRNLGECSKQLLKKNVDDSWTKKNVDLGIEPSWIGNDQITEAQFNVLSKELASSVELQENDDWIFLDAPSHDL